MYGTAITKPITELHQLQGQSPYSASKIGADMIVSSYHSAFGAPVVILRPFNTYGPRQSERAFANDICQAIDPIATKSSWEIWTPSRDCLLCFVSDTVSLLSPRLKQMIPNGRIFNSGTGRNGHN